MPSNAAYSASRAERDTLNNHIEVVVLGNQSIRDLTKEAKQLRAKVADIENASASARVTPVKGQGKGRPIVS